ncbi:hypothetical protein A2982_00740 [candidate division WWE3 bacterium RIFCSPLOWO2_01_FULL_39_13]|uniref:Uncharacterized protein n=1 Tax=candidate division WWE3 bacterium RIFCSPLOWO2_01_FULL_39_13 TaxID=1802624 RepID=A0A1F4V5B9_UNCKA|nr:MAG: hypothetical protein A2982_00740 [candidate division WWE3 bacterium RIFCSPLOWO2_01_FULL_39_13]
MSRDYYTKLDYEYVEKALTVGREYKKVWKEVARTRVQLFAAMVYRVINEGNEFDLILAPGNSGLYMSYITSLCYKYLRLNCPPILELPYQRLNDDKSIFDNSSLLIYIKQHTSKLKNIRNTLLVDDEIMMGTYAAITAKLFKKAKVIDNFNMVIIAENEFFEWHHDIPYLNMRYYAYGRIISGLNHNIAHLISDVTYNKVISALRRDLDYNQVMTIIVSGKLKSIGKNGILHFDNSADRILSKKLEHYLDIKESIKKELDDLVDTGITKYRNKVIKHVF